MDIDGVVQDNYTGVEKEYLVYTHQYLPHHQCMVSLVNGRSSLPLSSYISLEAVHLAAQEGHLNVVKLLVSKGANVHIETREKGRYAFYSACLQGHFEVVKFLRPFIANIDRKIKSGVTPLNATCGNGHLEIVKFLVEAGADVNSADNDGVTPMRVACWEGHLEIVRFLKECGADINKSANDESTPLSAASYNGRISVVMFLKESGAEVFFISL